MNSHRSVVFKWNRDELGGLAASCEHDELLPFVLGAAPRGACVLEAGCGAARWVRYLANRGRRIVGVEIGGDTLTMVRDAWPDLAILRGDCAALPFANDRFDCVLSFGVVEHWPGGPGAPLAEIHRVLRPDGVALVSVPFLKLVRRVKRWVWWSEVRALLAGRRIVDLNRLRRGFPDPVVPAAGKCFEYRLSRQRFVAEVTSAGLAVEHRALVGAIDGIFHDLNVGNRVIEHRDQRFHVAPLARWVVRLAAHIPILTAHMQVIFARKRAGSCCPS